MRHNLVILFALLMGACSLPGCVTDSATAHNKIKRTADGKEKRGEKQTDTATQSNRLDRDFELSITPGPVWIDPDLMPQAPDQKPPAPGVPAASATVAGAPAPAQKPAANSPAWWPMLIPQYVRIEDGEKIATVPVFPGATIKLSNAERKTENTATATSNELTTEEAWKAVRNTPREVWYIAGVGLLLSLVPLFVRGYRWLCPVIAGGTVAATAAFALTYSQGEILAYGVVGVVAAGALFALVLIWLQLRGKLRMQGAIVDIVSGVELAKNNLQNAAAQATEAAVQTTDKEKLESLKQLRDALVNSRETLKTSLGVKANDTTTDLVSRVKTTGRV